MDRPKLLWGLVVALALAFLIAFLLWERTPVVSSPPGLLYARASWPAL